MATKKINYKNLNLLLTRLEQLLDQPEAARFNMRHFGQSYRFSLSGILPVVVNQGGPVCKTQGCLAGETVLATGSGSITDAGGIRLTDGGYGWDIKSKAQEELGLTEGQAARLFFFKGMNDGRGWPKKFEKAYEAAKTPQGRLYVAIRRVEHFIKTKGRS